MKSFLSFIFTLLSFGCSNSNQTQLDNNDDKALPKALADKIELLSEQGNQAMELKKYNEAYKKFISALELIPKPIEKWSESTWLMASIGDVYFQTKDYKQGVKILQDCMYCPDAIGNPFIHLRLGQCQFETGNFDNAANELTRAYAIEGVEIFKDENPKYFEFLKTKIQI
jgi:tetratricopeptide (TPR) repeat protein